MCQWNDTVPVRVFIQSQYSKTGVARWDEKPIDRCIAPLVAALNQAGFHTNASCCGHGKGWGNIALADGRELLIAPDFDSARIGEFAIAHIMSANPSLTEQPS